MANTSTASIRTEPTDKSFKLRSIATLINCIREKKKACIHSVIAYIKKAFLIIWVLSWSFEERET